MKSGLFRITRLHPLSKTWSWFTKDPWSHVGWFKEDEVGWFEFKPPQFRPRDVGITVSFRRLPNTHAVESMETYSVREAFQEEFNEAISGLQTWIQDHPPALEGFATPRTTIELSSRLLTAVVTLMRGGRVGDTLPLDPPTMNLFEPVVRNTWTPRMNASVWRELCYQHLQSVDEIFRELTSFYFSNPETLSYFLNSNSLETVFSKVAVTGKLDWKELQAAFPSLPDPTTTSITLTGAKTNQSLEVLRDVFGEIAQDCQEGKVFTLPYNTVATAVNSLLHAAGMETLPPVPPEYHYEGFITPDVPRGSPDSLSVVLTTGNPRVRELATPDLFQLEETMQQNFQEKKYDRIRSGISEEITRRRRRGTEE